MVSIRIGSVTIEDVEIQENGCIYKIGARSRIREGMTLTQEFMAITNQSLRNLVAMAYNIERSGYDVGRLDRPILVEYCQKYLECSERTAYNYARALIWLRT